MTFVICLNKLQEEHSSQGLVPSNFSPSSQQSKTNGVGEKGLVGCFSHGDESRTGPQKLEADKWFNEMAPMTHRLLSALIMEDDLPDSNGVQRDILVEFPNSHNPYTVNRYLENELQASAITSNFGLSVDFVHSNSTSVVHQSMCNGFTASSNFINSNSENSVHSENLSDGLNFTVYPESGPLHDLIPLTPRQCQNPGKDFPLSPYEYQYGQMSMEDKILIELQSIGICPETVVCALNYGVALYSFLMEVYMHCLPGNTTNSCKTVVYDFRQPDMFLGVVPLFCVCGCGGGTLCSL
jgi:hypothetical protein